MFQRQAELQQVPAGVEGAVIPIVWAGGVPGKSKRADPVRIDLKPRSSPVVRIKQCPLKLEAGKGLVPIIEKFLKYKLLVECESKHTHTPPPILLVKKANGKDCWLVQDLRAINQITQDIHPVVANPDTLLTGTAKYMGIPTPDGTPLYDITIAGGQSYGQITVSAAFQRGSAKMTTQQEIQMEEPPQVSYNCACIQRCHLNDATPDCTNNNTIAVGLAKGCNSYMNSVDSQFDLALLHRFKPSVRWPVPRAEGTGWYWLCGNRARKILPLGWEGVCTRSPRPEHDSS